MSGFTITITDAGRAALINAQNTGTTAFVLSEVGVSTLAVTGSLKGLTALPNETKRLATMAGDVVANDTLHVTIRDESTSAYALRAFGLYTSTGVLFAVYSQAAPIIEKSSAAMLLLAVDAKLLTLDTEQVEFGPVGFTLPPASETVAGITEVATDAEADAGTDNWRYITPRLLKRALAALSGFAAIGHKHDAADIETGTFNASRIPSLAMSKITGLADALAAKAAAIHNHSIAQIEGLSVALGAKADTQHGHHADDINQGVFSVARIPALAMEKITGLAATLAAKANLNGADFTGRVWMPSHSTFKRSGGVDGGQIRLEMPEASTNLSSDVMIDVSGNDLRFYQAHSPYPGARLNLHGLPAGIGAYIWTSHTFNPALKANAHPWNDPDGSATVYARKAFISAGNKVIADGQDASISLEVGCGDDGAAMMVFDRRGKYGVMFGIDSDNKLKVGGLAMGRNSYEILHKGNTDFATAEQARNAAIGDRIITPAALWSFPRSINTSGYQQIPGTDLIIQWGSTNASFNEGAVHAMLPVAFGGGCLVAMAIPRNAAQSIPRDYYMQVVGRYQDRIVFYANHANAQSGTMIGYEWMAIGRASGTPDPVYSPPVGGGDVPYLP